MLSCLIAAQVTLSYFDEGMQVTRTHGLLGTLAVRTIYGVRYGEEEITGGAAFLCGVFRYHERIRHKPQ